MGCFGTRYSDKCRVSAAPSTWHCQTRYFLLPVLSPNQSLSILDVGGRVDRRKPPSCLGQQQALSLQGATPTRQHHQQSLQRHHQIPTLISKTQSSTEISFAAATNTLKNNRGWLLYDCHTPKKRKKERKKPTTSHVITPSEKTSRNGLCWASRTHGIMRKQNICQGSSNPSLPAQRYSEISKFTAKCYLEFLWHPE